MEKNKLYEHYATTHAGRKDIAAEKHVLQRDIITHLPASSSAVLDIGCGQGALVQALIESGFHDSHGVDISPEQVRIAHDNGVATVQCGDYRDVLGSRRWDAVVATDLLEHLSKEDVVELFALVRGALTSGGRLVARAPNATSPFGGNYQFSDFTHQTYFTPRSFAQVALNAGFASVESYACPPLVSGWRSGVRSAVFSAGSAVMRLLLAAETGRRDHIVTQNFVAVARTGQLLSGDVA